MLEYENYDKAIIVSGDGDFQCLARHLEEQGKLAAIFVPNQRKYSALLKYDVFKPYLRFVSDLRKKLSFSFRREPAGLKQKKNLRKD